MRTFKDKSWCMTECGNDSCQRNYNDTQRSSNTQNLPLSVMRFKNSNCGYIEPINKDKQDNKAEVTV